MDFITNLIALNVPAILVLLGGILLFSLFFEEVFGNKLRPGAQKKAAITGAFLVVVGVGLLVWTSIQSRSDAQSSDALQFLDLDQHSSSFYSFEGLDDPQVGNGRGRLIVKRDGGEKHIYTFEYKLPDQGEGYAGFMFLFSPALDMTVFDFLEITISRGDLEANCEVYLKRSSAFNAIRICDKSFINGNNIETRMIQDRLIVKIPLRLNFKDIDLTSVEEIGFSANSDFARGSHSFTVHDVKLIRQS